MKRPKAPEWPRLFRGYESREIQPLFVLSSLATAAARAIPLLHRSSHRATPSISQHPLAPCRLISQRCFPCISFWELFLVLSFRLASSFSHSPIFSPFSLSMSMQPSELTLSVPCTLFPNATSASAISSCVLEQPSFLRTFFVSLPTWIITSPARKAPSSPFFLAQVLFRSLTPRARWVKAKNAF